jgi:hypothetical protein
MLHSRGVVNFYYAGVATHDGRIGSRYLVVFGLEKSS